VSLTIEPDQGPATYTHYCVTDPELHLVTYLPTSAAQDTVLALAADIVLIRQ
jgi:hypothetical protein